MTRRDVVLVTADSVRYDAAGAMETLDDLDQLRGITAGHYTRPSLGGLHSGRLDGAIRSRVVAPSLAGTFADAGYTTVGFAATPQVHPEFGFDDGFDTYHAFADRGTRGSTIRERLSNIDLLRRVYHRVFPPHAKLSDLPADEAVVDRAIDRFRAADGPRFLWVHLMGTHRPYGRGADAIPESLDRKALFAPDRLSADERDQLDDAYRDAVGRAGDAVGRLREAVPDDAVFVFTSDHGDEFGEEGYYFHQPQRRRVAAKLVEVPVAVDGVDTVGDRCSLLDLPPTLASAVGIDPPAEWSGVDLATRERETTLTVAPWNDRATVLWQDFDRRLVATDATVTLADDDGRTAVDDGDLDGPTEQLRDLGYVG
ncbi:sulfatase-like hydrolase/transferase [Halosimplex halophilum]|uniref:sulfatase-like hydrolase/transferase n=1 Tax=Halosimplex halophilum TaxID=2559572 RepID=UPI00107F598B|nr:sulfatase-like hydrolase/transferase [Halosimplex halophilum]